MREARPDEPVRTGIVRRLACANWRIGARPNKILIIRLPLKRKTNTKIKIEVIVSPLLIA